MIPILPTDEEMLAMADARANGEEYTPSTPLVTEYPQGFKDFVYDNAERIKQARLRGTEPYFLRDNREVVNSILNSDKTINKIPLPVLTDDATENYIGQSIVEKGKDYIIGKRFIRLKTHDEVATTLSVLLGKRLGYNVEVVAPKDLIKLDTAKAYATEIEKLSRLYDLQQGKVVCIRLGYSTANPCEFGKVDYKPAESEKKELSLRAAFEKKYPDKAVSSSRCDSKYLGHSTATHEFGHLLYQFRGKSIGQNILFESKVQEIYDAYHKEVASLIKEQDMSGLAEIYLGNYADTNVNEFMSEAFQEYKNCQHPSKYAMEIGNLIDKWFKRK